MGVIKWRVGIVLAIIVVLALTACGGADDAGGEPTAPPPTEAPAATAPPQPPAEVEGQPPPTEVPSEPPEEAEVEIPHDVPIMEGATKLVVQETTGSVTYVMEDMEIEEVVDFYMTAMADQGWENKTASAVGLMASLVFETETARTSVALQANNFAKTVTVRLYIFDK